MGAMRRLRAPGRSAAHGDHTPAPTRLLTGDRGSRPPAIHRERHPAGTGQPRASRGSRGLRWRPPAGEASPENARHRGCRIDRPRRPDRSPTPPVPQDRSPIPNTRWVVWRAAPVRAMFPVPPIVVADHRSGRLQPTSGRCRCGSGALHGPHPSPRRPPPIPPEVHCTRWFERQSGRPGRGANMEPDGAVAATPSARLRLRAQPARLYFQPLVDGSCFPELVHTSRRSSSERHVGLHRRPARERCRCRHGSRWPLPHSTLATQLHRGAGSR